MANEKKKAEGQMAGVDEIIQGLKYGTQEEKIEAITLARGKVNSTLLMAFLHCEGHRVDRLEKDVNTRGPLSRVEAERIMPALTEEAAKGDGFVSWYAAILLTEYGVLNKDMLDFIWSGSNTLMSWLVPQAESAIASKVRWN